MALIAVYKENLGFCVHSKNQKENKTQMLFIFY